MTERQLDVLNFIKDFIKVKGFSPSYTDIAKGLGMSSKSNIHRLVHSLREQGLLKMKPYICLLYTSPSPRDRTRSRMPSSA